jgi:murein L,D-transpeptidase YafK
MNSCTLSTGLIAALLISLLAFAPLTWSKSSDYVIEISKSKREMLLKRDDDVLKRYSIASGRGGSGDKQFTGDLKTPVGTYRIVRFNDSSKFHRFLLLNYPNVKDAFFGFKSDLINRREFDLIIDALRKGKIPPQNTKLGGAIGIHGIGDINSKKLRIHNALDWTEGCVALTNEDIEELRRRVPLGTKVVITE